MQASLAAALRARRPAIRTHWDTLLRAEPVTTPLAHPDALVHLIDRILDEFLSQIGISSPELIPESVRHTECHCGRNPLLRFFTAGEQALKDALILSQAAAAPISPLERDTSLKELDHLLRQLARREIQAFCMLCQVRSPGAS